MVDLYGECLYLISMVDLYGYHMYFIYVVDIKSIYDFMIVSRVAIYGSYVIVSNYF